MQTEVFTYLFEQYLHKRYSQEEKSEFFLLLKQPEYHPLLEQLSERYAVPVDQAPQVDEEAAAQILQSILQFQEDGKVIPADSARAVHRVHFLRRWGWAAAVIVVLVSAAYLLTTSKKIEQPLTNGNKALQGDILPGSNKAVLTLSDGTTITLDSAANGQLAEQSGSNIIKRGGQVIYETADKLRNDSRAISYNTMSTPKGGQYQLRLPDGTKVLLNAASSITYPTVFVGNERHVQLKGEAYFEVTKNPQKPFTADVDGKCMITVLGTQFNVNSYADEGAINTTLVEGSVIVAAKDGRVILQPGQQAQILTTSANILVNADADLDQALAWKNGIFNFNGANLLTVMRQLERWYDINVQYKSSASNIIFKGKMYRNVNLSDVLAMLKEMGVKFELEGKNLIVL